MADILVDFDGTMVEFKYPDIGEELSLAFFTVKQLKQKGHKLILWTCRSGKELLDADNFCKERGLIFDYVNSNPDENWRDVGPKAFGHLMIDDTALGAPLNDRGYMDWIRVRQFLIKRSYL